jgi:hypothetical protein
MASERQTGEPRRGGGEYDAFSRWCRSHLAGFGRPGYAKRFKQQYNQRVRHKARIAVRLQEGWND